MGFVKEFIELMIRERKSIGW